MPDAENIHQEKRAMLCSEVEKTMLRDENAYWSIGKGWDRVVAFYVSD